VSDLATRLKLDSADLPMIAFYQGYPSKVAELLRCMYPSIVATNRTLGVRLVRTPSVAEGWIWKNIRQL